LLPPSHIEMRQGLIGPVHVWAVVFVHHPRHTVQRRLFLMGVVVEIVSCSVVIALLSTSLITTVYRLVVMSGVQEVTILIVAWSIVHA